MATKSDELLEKMMEDVKKSHGNIAKTALPSIKQSLEEISQCIVKIETMLLSGSITQKQADILFHQQKVKSISLLELVKGIKKVIATELIESALRQIMKFVNGAVGFELIKLTDHKNSK